MKVLIRILGATLIIFLAHALLTTKVHAVTFSYPSYDVDIQIAKDSTFIVTEKANYILNGEAHGLRRDLTLYNSEKSQQCIANPDLTCGGFDRIKVLSVTDNTGRELNSNEFNFYNVSEGGSDYARFEWTIWKDGKDVTNYAVGWTIQYKVYGGIQKIGNNPYFYWNMLPESRGGIVKNSTLQITFPDGTKVKEDSLSIFADYNYKLTVLDNGFKFGSGNLSDYGNFTIGYKFEPEEIILPGSIEYVVTTPEFGTEIYLDNTLITSETVSGLDGKIGSIEAGSHLFEVRHVGYQTYSQVVNIESGKTVNIETSLQPETWMSFLLILNNVFIFLGCLFVPLAVIFVYLYYRRNGRDKNMPKTIIPLFEPPKTTPPYLLGTLKDESVDREDIVGSIIDLAYRGFIKIREITKDENYELIRLDKDTKELNETELAILDAVFNGQDSRETKNMQTYFPLKYVKLTATIYDEVVEKGFFSKSPKTTIGTYVGFGILLLFLGIGSLIFLTAILIPFLGYFTVFTFGLALSALGFCFLIAAKFMPAKTELGSKVFADILGFKMYLHTAERFRLQKLGPDEFEKYLSYAVVFKIEKEWAKKFEGIYNKQPDWFEGNYSAWDVWVISNFASSFRTAGVASMTPISSQSASGSGWSGGGGSFGGFSGGGGGGGSSGGW